MRYEEYIAWLKNSLIPEFTPPHVPAGNDWLHCDRMAKWGKKILGVRGLPDQGAISFNLQEFEVACWLHNVDRSESMRQKIRDEFGDYKVLYLVRTLYKFFANADVPSEQCPIPNESRNWIVDAVMQHAKFADEPGDSHLLTALRIADKIDRLDDSTMGIIGACAMRGVQVLAYDPKRPFNYTSTEEGKLKSIYNDFMRQLEWYGMLPSDEARTLVSDDSMRFYVAFIRRFARLISRHTGFAYDAVEHDLEKALGPYFSRFSC